MQLTILSLFCATLLNGGVDADVKECQDIKTKFLGCTTKWDTLKRPPHHDAGHMRRSRSRSGWGETVGRILPRGRLATIWRVPYRSFWSSTCQLKHHQACNNVENAIQAISGVSFYEFSVNYQSEIMTRVLQKTSMNWHFQTCGGSLEGKCFTHAEVNSFICFKKKMFEYFCWRTFLSDYEDERFDDGEHTEAGKDLSRYVLRFYWEIGGVIFKLCQTYFLKTFSYLYVCSVEE